MILYICFSICFKIWLYCVIVVPSARLFYVRVQWKVSWCVSVWLTAPKPVLWGVCPGYIPQGCDVCVHSYELLHIEYTLCYGYLWQGEIKSFNEMLLLHLLKGFSRCAMWGFDKKILEGNLAAKLPKETMQHMWNTL